MLKFGVGALPHATDSVEFAKPGRVRAGHRRAPTEPPATFEMRSNDRRPPVREGGPALQVRCVRWLTATRRGTSKSRVQRSTPPAAATASRLTTGASPRWKWPTRWSRGGGRRKKRLRLAQRFPFRLGHELQHNVLARPDGETDSVAIAFRVREVGLGRQSDEETL